MALTDKFRIKAAFHEEAREGWVWITKDERRRELEEPKGTFIKITNPKNGKKIVCDCRIVDRNFMRIYNERPTKQIEQNESTIIIHEYYRKILDINDSKNEIIELCVEKINNICGSFVCNWTHPNPNIRASYRIGFIGLLIAIATPLFYTLKKTILFFWHLSCC